MSQLRLDLGVRHVLAERWHEVLDVVNPVIGELGLKDVAFELDVAGTSISNAQHNSPRHPFHGRWLLYLILKDKSKRLIGALCRMAGGRFVPDEPLTEAERLRRLEGALDQLDPDLASLIRRKAGV